MTTTWLDESTEMTPEMWARLLERYPSLERDRIAFLAKRLRDERDAEWLKCCDVLRDRILTVNYE